MLPWVPVMEASVKVDNVIMSDRPSKRKNTADLDVLLIFLNSYLLNSILWCWLNIFFHFLSNWVSKITITWRPFFQLSFFFPEGQIKQWNVYVKHVVIVAKNRNNIVEMELFRFILFLFPRNKENRKGNPRFYILSF